MPEAAENRHDTPKHKIQFGTEISFCHNAFRKCFGREVHREGAANTMNTISRCIYPQTLQDSAA